MFEESFIDTRNEKTKVTYRESQKISDKRKLSNKEPEGFHEIPTVEIQFTLSSMIESAVKVGKLDKEYVKQIMEQYSNLTRCKDFGLSCIIPVEEDKMILIQKDTDNKVYLHQQKDAILEKLQKPADMGVIMGGWTSSISFAQQEAIRSNDPKNEANLAQQFFGRKDDATKKNSIVLTCAGPGIEKNELADTVTPDKPFGPSDHMLAMAAATTLFGKSDVALHTSFFGHSMGGAAMIDLLLNYKLPKNSSIVSVSAAIPGANPWANAAERVFQKFYNATSFVESIPHNLRTIPQQLLAIAVSGGMDVLDTLVYSDVSQKYLKDLLPYYPAVKKNISTLATGQLFLPGDKENMPELVAKHVVNFGKYPDSSTFGALGSILDMPLDSDRLLNKMREVNCALVADKDDQMVDTISVLKQLPREIPFFVLDDGDKGSHMAFKRNERHLRLSLLGKAAEQFSTAQYTFLTENLCKQLYSRRIEGAPIDKQAIIDLMNTNGQDLERVFNPDLTPVSRREYRKSYDFVAKFLLNLGDQVHFNDPNDPLLHKPGAKITP